MRKIYSLFRKLLCMSVLFSNLAGAQHQSRKDQVRQKIMADKNVSAVEISEERLTPSFIDFDNSSAYSSAKALPLLANYLDARPGVDVLQKDKSIQLNEQEEVVVFQQFYKDIKVDRATFKAYINKGSVKFYNGAYYRIPDETSVTPKLNMKEALLLAKEKVGASKYALDEYEDAVSKATDTKLKATLTAAMQDALPGGELVLIKDFSNKQALVIRLAYKFNIYATKPLSRSYVYVDANDGHILLLDPIIKHLADEFAPPPPVGSVSTPVQTRYAGTRNIYVKQISGNDPQNGLPLVSSHPVSEPGFLPGSSTYVLMDDTRGNGIETYDLNAIGGLPISVAPAYNVAKSFTDVDNNWTVAEHKRGVGTGVAAELENDDIAWDAHWGAEMVYDYWKNKHNRLSFDGNNAKIKSFIHSGAVYDNAFWNGTVMTYGDGSYPAPGGFRALTSLDVCGHEIGHGVCSHTSDLVYANESGAMNEALSDIWASCIEYYAIKNVDPALGAVYKPFYIGEQISADPASPLRRMDDPKTASNPDTYGGTYWTDQTGCTPNLVNDECGVHNNSGVLNKWFYLITVGSGAGSGPNASYAGSDDGFADSVAGIHPSYAYSVTGLGFDVSEKITFLMETMLSSTATYAEARMVSIAAATQLSGSPCSAWVETVTNAWYAVGVGGKFVKPCSLTFGFLTTGASSATSETGTATGCASSKTINIPVILPALSVATINTGGTATNGKDYALGKTSITNTFSYPYRWYIPVKILNDASVEGDETLLLNVTLTNAGSAVVNSSYTLTIMDDDVVPVLSNGAKTLLSETFTRADGFNDLSGWTETLEISEAPNGDAMAVGKNQWGIFDNRLAITGREGLTGITLPNRTYNNFSESKTIIKTPLIDARGLSAVKLKFDYLVQGEVDPASGDVENFPALDYMAVAYSFDGVKFNELTNDGLRQFASLLGDSGTVNVSLPPSFDNRQFYLAFRWYNDANAGGPVSVSVDNLGVTAVGRSIENHKGNYTAETLNGGDDVYFLSRQSQQLLGRVKNNSSQSLGCTAFTDEREGDVPLNLYRDANNKLHKVSGKIVHIAPGVNSTSASNTVTLFYTEAQLAALETATGKARTSFSIYRIDTTKYELVKPGNTTIYPANYTAISGIGGMYTFTYTGRLYGSYALGIILSPGAKGLPAEAAPATKTLLVDKIYPNPAHNSVRYILTSGTIENITVSLTTLTGQVAKTQSAKVISGTNSILVQTGDLASGVYFISLRNEKGEILDRQKFIKN